VFDHIEQGRGTGLIAQELQEVLPEAVHKAPDSEYLTVAYGNTVGLLVEAIKELSAQNKALMARLEALEAKE
jgi:pyruvate/2-oxoacid:ferredoxin oxidoreductase alpha subunit